MDYIDDYDGVTPEEEYYEDPDFNEKVDYVINTASNYSIEMQEMDFSAIDPFRFEIRLEVSDITENSAQLSADISSSSSAAFYTASGYRYSDGSTEKEISAYTYDTGELSSVTLTGLKPFTKYTAYAFVKANGTEHRSRAITFTTQGTFAVSDTQLFFEGEGGTQSVGVEYDKNAVKSWNIASKPGWCNIEKNEKSFTVSVGETETERSGIIVVTAETEGGEPIKCSISVQQEAKEKKMSWDNTAWLIKGEIIIKSEYFTQRQPIDYKVYITDVENGDHSLTGEVTDQNPDYQLYCDESTGNLILVYNYKNTIEGVTTSMDMKFIFVRMDENSAETDVSGSFQTVISINGTTDVSKGTVSGHMTSIRINE